MRALILAERPDGCAARLRDAGVAADIAEEIAFYLDQTNDLEAEGAPLLKALADNGIEGRIADPTVPDAWIDWLRERPADTLVWAVTDGVRFYRGSGVIGMARLFGAPTFGSSPQAYALAQDKAKTAATARALGVTAPAFGLLRDGYWLTPPPAGEGPWFVKPNTLGAKIGIWEDSRVDSLRDAASLSRRIHGRYGDDAVVQPFIEGRDVRVSYMAVGEDMELERLGTYRLETASGKAFVTLDDSYGLVGQPGADGRPRGGADLVDLRDGDPKAQARIAAMARSLADGMGLRDLFSLDIRLGADGTPWLLEMEVCPAVTIFDFKRYLRDYWSCDLPAAVAAAFARRVQQAPDP